MNISSEAVESAVHAYMQYPRSRGLDNTEAMFRAALEAAAPYLMAQAWDEGREADDFEVSIGMDGNPYRKTPHGNH